MESSVTGNRAGKGDTRDKKLNKIEERLDDGTNMMTDRQGIGSDEKDRQIWKLGTWNIRSLNGKEEELSDEFDRLNLDILTVTETKKKGKGEKQLVNGHLLIYSGVAQDKRASEGVGCIINKEMVKQIRRWEGHSERLLSVEINMHTEETVTIIAAYGPNEDEKVEIKNKFWEDLNEVTEQCKGKIFVAGDLNGRVGNDNSGSSAIGKHGEEKRNSNGTRILEYCLLNNMVVTNTFFQHKEIHKYTREGKSKSERSVIDYILSERNNRRDVLDVRVRRGPEIYSDHYLLVAKMRKKPEEHRSTEDNKKLIYYETIKAYKLRDREYALKYKEEVTRKIQTVDRDQSEENVENLWLAFKTAVTEAARETCGILRATNGRKQTEWWNREVKQEVKLKKERWHTYLNKKDEESYELYKKQRIKVKNMIKEAKEKSWQKFGEKMETSSKENQKLFYRTMKNMRKGKTIQDASIKTDEGDVIKDGEQIMNRWKQYFEELLGTCCEDTADKQTEARGNVAGSTRQEKEFGSESQLISIEELRGAVAWLKNGKAPGHDRITAEMLKNLSNEGLQMLLEVFNKVWAEKRIPNDWKVGIIVPIHKKGDTRNCNNYRGITLLSAAVKTYERILERRLATTIEPTLKETQSGFRKGRSIQDHIFTIRQIIHKTLLSRSRAFFAFIDLEKAFDKVRRQTVWNILEKRKVNKQLLEAIKSVYTESLNYVACKNMKSDVFETPEGLRQGGVLSPVLFCVFMDEIMKECTPKVKKLTIGYRRLAPVEISECVFADDVVIMARSECDLQKNLVFWDEALVKYGMKINSNKTKVMMVARETEEIDIKLREEKIQQVTQYKYLGVTIENSGRQETDIEERIDKTVKTYHAIRASFIKKKEISKGTKMTIFKTIFRPILTFGSESWVLNRRLESKLQAVEMKFLRSVKGVTRMDRVRNTDIREELGTSALLEFIEERQLSWWGHLQRLGENRQVKKIWEARVRIRRDRGRPAENWENAVAKIIQRRGKSLQEARALAVDRKQWTKFVHE